jgi:hypothetical protein
MSEPLSILGETLPAALQDRLVQRTATIFASMVYFCDYTKCKNAIDIKMHKIKL